MNGYQKISVAKVQKFSHDMAMASNLGALPHCYHFLFEAVWDGLRALVKLKG